jgi:hypothetical protein
MISGIFKVWTIPPVNLYNDKRETCRTPFERAPCRTLLCPAALIGGLMTNLKNENIVMLGNQYIWQIDQMCSPPSPLHPIIIVIMDRVLALTLMQWQSQNPKVLNHQGPIRKPLAHLQLSVLQFEESDLAFMFWEQK